MTICAHCDDEFEPVEYATPSIDDPNYCSDDCECEELMELEDRNQDYAEGRYSGAPVF